MIPKKEIPDAPSETPEEEPTIDAEIRYEPAEPAPDTTEPAAETAYPDFYDEKTPAKEPVYSEIFNT